MVLVSVAIRMPKHIIEVDGGTNFLALIWSPSCTRINESIS